VDRQRTRQLLRVSWTEKKSNVKPSRGKKNSIKRSGKTFGHLHRQRQTPRKTYIEEQLDMWTRRD